MDIHLGHFLLVTLNDNEYHTLVPTGLNVATLQTYVKWRLEDHPPATLANLEHALARIKRSALSAPSDRYTHPSKAKINAQLRHIFCAFRNTTKGNNTDSRLGLFEGFALKRQRVLDDQKTICKRTRKENFLHSP